MGSPSQIHTHSEAGAHSSARFRFHQLSPRRAQRSSYARTLLHLRWAAQNTALLGSHALQAHEAAELTLHSVKSTMLANAAQITASALAMTNLATKHGNKTLCLRFNRGQCNNAKCKYAHLCAIKLPNGQVCGQKFKNTTFSSLHVQRTVAEAVAKGFRNAAWQEERKRRSQNPPFPYQSLSLQSTSRTATSERETGHFH